MLTSESGPMADGDGDGAGGPAATGASSLSASMA